MASSIEVPRPPPGADPSGYLDRLADAVQRALDDMAQTAAVGIAVSNVTPPATFDASTATAAESAQALGQLLVALRTAGRIT